MKVRIFSWKLVKENLTGNLKIMKAIRNSTFLIKDNDKNVTRSTYRNLLKKLETTSWTCFAFLKNVIVLSLIYTL